MPIRANVRIVCATHRDLRGMVERGEFREDLYYRLRGITLEVPPLRARLGDVPRISASLLDRVAVERSERPKKLSEAAVQVLMRHRWPGNVRELENALRAASLFAEGDIIQLEDLLENVDDLRAALATPPESPRTGPISASKPVLPVSPVSREPADTLQPRQEENEGADFSAADGSGEFTGRFAGQIADDADEDDDDLESDNEEMLSDFDETGSISSDEETGATKVAYACIKQGTLSLPDLKRQIERDCIARALAETRGNITRAATLLGMKRPRLSQLVKQYGLLEVSEGS